MWEWLHRRRVRRQAQSSRQPANQAELAPSSNGSPDLSTRPSPAWSSQLHPFFVPSPVSTSPPKCISRLPCSQILYGERVEDFSTDCWLENHLHRFGCPLAGENRTSDIPSPIVEESDDSITSDGTESDLSTLAFTDIGSLNDIDFDHEYDHGSSLQGDAPLARRRLALEELFSGPLIHDQSPVQLELTPLPPPYTLYPEDPPPTYEEAMAALERRSNSTRSSSLSSSMFLW